MNTKDGIVHRRVTIGFVVQTYRTIPEGEEDGFTFCEDQVFVAGEESWEDESGDAIEDIKLSKDEECPCLMVQPKTIPEQKDAEFEQWFTEYKSGDGVQRHYRSVIENNPDYDLNFKQWCRTYYDECVDI